MPPPHTHIHAHTLHHITHSYMHSISADALIKDHFAIYAVTTIAMLKINYFFLKHLFFYCSHITLWCQKQKIINFLFMRLFFLSFFATKWFFASASSGVMIYWYAFTYSNFLQTRILNLSICVFIDYQSCIYRVVPAALRSNMRVQRQRDVVHEEKRMSMERQGPLHSLSIYDFQYTMNTLMKSFRNYL